MHYLKRDEKKKKRKKKKRREKKKKPRDIECLLVMMKTSPVMEYRMNDIDRYLQDLFQCTMKTDNQRRNDTLLRVQWDGLRL